MKLCCKEAYAKGQAAAFEAIEMVWMKQHKEAEDGDGFPECEEIYNQRVEIISDVYEFDDKGSKSIAPPKGGGFRG